MDTSSSPIKSYSTRALYYFLALNFCRVEPALKQDAKMTMLHEIKELPVHAQSNKIMLTEECVTVLLNADLKESSICSRVPFAVDINAAL